MLCDGPWLIACEYSQVVCQAFRRHGIEAYSCDLDPTEGNPEWHIQRDALEVAYNFRWRGMVAHPECTKLTNAANRWLYEDCKTGTAAQRWIDREKQIDFILKLQQAPIYYKAIENSAPHPYVMERIGRWTQKVQPYQFGHLETKGICLWLENLPPLMETDNVYKEMMKLPYKDRAKVHCASPGKDRSKIRAKFLPGVGNAMADQWGWL